MKTRVSLWAAAALAMGAAMPTLANAQQNIIALKGAPRTYVQSSAAEVIFSQSGFQRVTRLDNIRVPAGWTGIFVATFGGESACETNSAPEAQCSIRIACDGVPLLPDQAADFTFNSYPRGYFPRGLSVTRRSAPVTAGTHSCEVLSRQANAFHSLDDWTFTVEFWRRS